MVIGFWIVSISSLFSQRSIVRDQLSYYGIFDLRFDEKTDRQLFFADAHRRVIKNSLTERKRFGPRETMIHCSDCCHIASGGVSRRKDRIRRSDDSPNVEARTGVKMDGIYRIGLRGLSRTALLLAICLLHTGE